MTETTQEEMARKRSEKAAKVAETRSLTPEEKEELRIIQAKAARQEELEKRSGKDVKKSGDDLLEAAYAGLAITYADLKLDIEQYFYENGRWEDPAKAVDEADKAAEKQAKEDEKAAKGPVKV